MPSVSYTHTGWDLGGWRFGNGAGDRERGLGAASQRLQNVDGLTFGLSWVLKSD